MKQAQDSRQLWTFIQAHSSGFLRMTFCFWGVWQRIQVSLFGTFFIRDMRFCF